MSKIIKKFTRRVPKWKPRVKPIEQREATQEQIEALKITPSNTKISEYVLTLAHDVESLSIRSPLFNAIMYDEGGLSRSERELGAIAASMVNHCIYCAAVHADRHAKLEKILMLLMNYLIMGLKRICKNVIGRFLILLINYRKHHQQRQQKKFLN